MKDGGGFKKSPNRYTNCNIPIFLLIRFLSVIIELDNILFERNILFLKQISTSV